MNDVPKSLALSLESGESLSLELRRVVGFLSPHFTLVLRDSSTVTRNSSAAHPSCLYRGQSRDRNIDVAVSTCGPSTSAVVVIDGVPHSLELSGRQKREAEWKVDREETVRLEVVKKMTHEAKCGLNQKNLKRLMVNEKPVVRLRRQTRRSRRSAEERVIELGVFVDSEGGFRGNVNNNIKDFLSIKFRLPSLDKKYLRIFTILF